MRVDHFEIYFSGQADRHHFGNSFPVHKNLEPYVKDFNPILKRIAILQLNTKPINKTLVCMHARKRVKVKQMTIFIIN